MFTEKDIAAIQEAQKNPGTLVSAKPVASPDDNGGTPPVDTNKPAEGQGQPPAPGAGSPNPGGTPPPAGGEKPTPTPAGGTPPPQDKSGFDITTLGFKDQNELQERLKKTDEFEKKVQLLSKYENGPVFESERQKLLYELSKKAPGMELKAARQLLEVVDMDLKSTPDQQLRYFAFKLDPKNGRLSEDQIRALFVDEDLKQYGDPADAANPPTEVQKIRAQQATDLAREQLSEMQTNWNTSKDSEAPSPAQIAERKQARLTLTQAQLADFDGIQISLEATDEKGEKMSNAIAFKVDPKDQLPVVVQAVADPAGWWEQKLTKLGINYENPTIEDQRKFAKLVTAIEFGDRLQNLAYQQGQSDTLAAQLAEKRNLGQPGGDGPGIIPDPNKLTGQAEVNRKAMQAAGLIKS